jgi:hypothetical protein
MALTQTFFNISYFDHIQRTTKAQKCDVLIQFINFVKNYDHSYMQ